MKLPIEIENDIIGENHQMTSIETPLRKDAFILTDDEKIEIIQEHFEKIMDVLGLDLNDDSLRGTPYRVAKMYVKELFYGLDPKNKPQLSTFKNSYQYDKTLIEKNIQFYSMCEHHFLTIKGKAHVGYISNGIVIGLSKINRIVDYYARRPQVQERLTIQIFNELRNVLQTESIIVVIEAEHLCVSSRGIKDIESSTTTLEYSGDFENATIRSDFFNLIKN